MTRTLTLDWFFLLALGFAMCACSDAPAGTDSGVRPDAGRMDSGVSVDAGPDGTDAGPDGTDAGPDGTDGGSMDGAVATPDGGASDGGADAALPDAGLCMDLPPGPRRPIPVECSACRPPSTSTPARGDCLADSDCTGGDNGRCVNTRFGGTCSYDECFKDDDCAAGELCLCDGSRLGGNACITAGCHTDAECGAYPCSPTLGTCGHYTPPVAYQCHSAADDCQSDSECGVGYCAFDTLRGVWACSTLECAG